MPTAAPTLWHPQTSAAAPAADPTLAFAQKFADPSQWEVMRDVPYFDEHQEVDDESGETLKFGPGELEELVRNTNRMVALGKPPGLTLGHTDDDKPEDQQPVPIGFAKNFRVQRFGPERKLGIVADEYYLPGKLDVARTYPFRSVERWRKGKYFSPIALLRREPRRPLGVVGYRQIGGDAVIRYSMRYQMPNEPTPPAAPPPESQMPAPPPEEMEPSDKDRQLFEKLVSGHKHLGPMCQKYAQEIGEPADGQEHAAGKQPKGEFQDEPVEQAVAKNAMGAASGTNIAIPPMKPTTVPASAHNAKPADVTRYQALEREVASLKRESRMARYSKVLADLRTREGIQFDEAEELLEVQDYDEATFQKHVKKMRTNYRKLPIDDQPIRLGDLPAPASQQDDGRVKDKATMEKVLKYQQQNPGVSWEKARDTVIKGG